MVLKTLPTELFHVDPSELKNDPHHLAPLLRSVIHYCRPERILDATAGSGITARVANDDIIPCITHDLNDPSESQDLFAVHEPNGYDLVVYHPDLWRARPDGQHPHDLGAVMTWDAYVELNRDAIVHLAHQTRPAGHLLVIAPIARHRGEVHNLARDLQCVLGAPMEPEIIHPHPFCRSRGTLYGKRFVPIAHDNVLLWTKEEVLLGAGLLDAGSEAADPMAVQASAGNESTADQGNARKAPRQRAPRMTQIAS